MKLVSRNEYAPMPIERDDKSVAIALFVPVWVMFDPVSYTRVATLRGEF